MERISVPIRPEFSRRLDEHGFRYPTGPARRSYWVEDAAYVFSEEEAERLYEAGTELHRLCLQAVGEIVRKGDYHRFDVRDEIADAVEKSWNAKEGAVYGRFDMTFAPGEGGILVPKMMEYNADTPAALVESSVAQWEWLQAHCESEDPEEQGFDQYNDIHEKLVARWKGLRLRGKVHFTCGFFTDASGQRQEAAEDKTTIEYLKYAAEQAGLDCEFIPLYEVGWNGQDFLDLRDQPIKNLVKLYPWEWIEVEQFGPCVPLSKTRFIEPAWKRLLSDKTILAVLWEMFPGHPNLLPAWTDPARVESKAVTKPVRGREGSLVTLPGEAPKAAKNEQMILHGGNCPVIHQGFCPVPSFRAGAETLHAVVDLWMIGDEAAGIGVREEENSVTTEGCRYVPHFVR